LQVGALRRGRIPGDGPNKRGNRIMKPGVALPLHRNCAPSSRLRSCGHCR